MLSGQPVATREGVAHVIGTKIAVVAIDRVTAAHTFAAGVIFGTRITVFTDCAVAFVFTATLGVARIVCARIVVVAAERHKEPGEAARRVRAGEASGRRLADLPVRVFGHAVEERRPQPFPTRGRPG